MLSFIVPAHNEQSCLGRTLQSIHAAVAGAGAGAGAAVAYEIVVVDDGSTDATANVARENNAVVVSVNHRQIAATRNAGARAAKGERLIFVDADTLVPPGVLASAVRQLDRGVMGGGALPRFSDPVPLWATMMLEWLGWMMRIGGMTGGAFLFCTRDAFNATGGFDERLFGAEDAAMCYALRRHGRFVVLWPRILTSGRRVRGGRGLKIMATLVAMAFSPRMLTRRSAVQKVWYESDRRNDDDTRETLVTRIVNGLMLLIVVALITTPLWNLLPASLTPEGSALHTLRLAFAVISCHVALLLWPCAYFLIRALLRQPRWIERLKLVALIALCLWLAWGATPVVIWFWRTVFDWLL